MTASQPAGFAARLTDACRSVGTPLCVGMDPHLDMIPPLFRRGSMQPGAAATAAAVSDYCYAMLPLLARRVALIKPQLALFEQLGPEGMMLLARFAADAAAEGMLVVMDGKRGDIGSTSAAYARAWLGRDAPFPADALTVNPFLGLDTLAPFLETADATASGLFVLVRTSNGGSADLQEVIAADGRPLWLQLACRLAPLAEARTDDSGFSSLGVVIGAGHAEQAIQLRQILPTALFLVPGFGAQGGDAATALAGLVAGPEGPEGGIINSSRGIGFPTDAADSRVSTDWRQAVCRSLEATILALR